MVEKNKSILKRGLRIAGVFLFSLGFLLMLNPVSGITGYSISEDVNENPLSVFSVVVIVLGLIVFLSGLEKRKESIEDLIQLGLETPAESPKN